MFEQNVALGPGAGSFTAHTFEIFIMLGVAFIFGLWLGWILWSRFKQQADAMRLEFDSLNAAVGVLRSENEQLKSKIIDLEAHAADLQSKLALATDEARFLQDQNKAREERLKMMAVENRRLMMDLGLAAAPDGNDEPALEIVAPAMPAPEPIPEIPATPKPENDHSQEVAWPVQEPAQPRMYGEDDAVAFVSETPYEPEPLPVAPPEPPKITAAEIMMPTSILPASEQERIDPPTTDEPEDVLPLYVMAGPRDDLKLVEGIGPKIEEILYKNGIHTYGELARTPVTHLKEILQEAGSRYALHDPGTWSAQALLAANGEWDNLKAYQEFLSAGKRPK